MILPSPLAFCSSWAGSRPDGLLGFTWVPPASPSLEPATMALVPLPCGPTSIPWAFLALLVQATLEPSKPAITSCVSRLVSCVRAPVPVSPVPSKTPEALESGCARRSSLCFACVAAPLSLWTTACLGNLGGNQLFLLVFIWTGPVWAISGAWVLLLGFVAALGFRISNFLVLMMLGYSGQRLRNLILRNCVIWLQLRL